MSAPSLFNDVLGPVMRGPSSSHSAAASRIGRLARALLREPPRRVVVDYDPTGTLVTTHRTQGSDLGLAGGLLGWEADDERLADYEGELARAGIELEVRYLDYGAEHPNTYRLTLSNESESRTLTAVSTGGGMIEVRSIDGLEVVLRGDLHELLVELPDGADPALGGLAGEFGLVEVRRLGGALLLRSRAPFPDALRNRFCDRPWRELPPVMPVLAGDPAKLPFRSAAEFLPRMAADPVPLWRWSLRYEAARSGWGEQRVFDEARAILAVMRRSLERGLEGRELPNALLPTQVKAFERAAAGEKLVPGSVPNRSLHYVTGIMEAKAGLEVIVAAPTAGSCAALPAALLAVADTVGCDETSTVRGLLAAGLLGVFIAEGATFSAELGGCMAECGSASGMAAAAITEMMGGSSEQAISAASQALQNMFGLTCDPIASRVEAPCLGKNAMAASNAINCANMALAGYEHLIPLDEVLAAMDEVGRAMPRELCCTALGGLSVTPTSRALQARLDGKPGC